MIFVCLCVNRTWQKTINDFTNCLQLLRKGRKQQSNCLFGVEKKSINCQTGDTQSGFKVYVTMGVILTGD